MLMRRTGDNARFYVYLADGQVVGPLSYRAALDYGAEAWVRVDEGEELWPMRRWTAEGKLNSTLREHYQAWVWLLAFAPALAWFFMPELLRVEWGIAWMMALVCAFVGMLWCKRDSPRFPVE